MAKSNDSRQRQVVSSNPLPSALNTEIPNEKDTSNTECETATRRLSRPAMIIHDAAGCVTEIKIACTSNLQEAQKGQENGNT